MSRRIRVAVHGGAPRRGPLRSRGWPALFCVITLWIWQPAHAEPDWVVLEAGAAEWEPGTLISPEAALHLPEGASLVVVSATGQQRTIAGPYRGSLGDALAHPVRSDDAAERVVIGATRGSVASVRPDVAASSPILVDTGGDPGPIQELLRGGDDPALSFGAQTSPDVRLRAERSHVWIEAPASHPERLLRTRVSLVGTPEQRRALLRDRIEALARANRLLRLVTLANPAPPELALTLVREHAGQSRRVSAEAGVALEHGDRIELRMENRGDAELDLNVLWIDARGDVMAVFPAEEGHSNRIPVGGSRTIAGEIDTSRTHGHEYLVLLGVTRGPRAPMLVLSKLADAPFAVTRPGSGGSPATDAAPAARAGLELDLEAACPGCGLFGAAYSLETRPLRDPTP